MFDDNVFIIGDGSEVERLIPNLKLLQVLKKLLTLAGFDRDSNCS